MFRRCDMCRQQKEKCEGGIPCLRCSRLHRECILSRRRSSWRPAELSPTTEVADEISPTRSQSPRHIQPPTPVMNKDQEPSVLSRRVVYLEKIVQHKLGPIHLDLQTLQALSEEAEKHNESISPTENAAPDHETPAVDEKCSIQSVEDTVAHYSGEFSHWNFSMRIKKWIEQNISQDQARSSMAGLSEFYRSKDLQCLSSTMAAVSSLPPRFVATFLIHCFFKHAVTNYFYVDRDWLLAKVEIAYANPASLGRSDAGTMCMIFGILAIGTHYAYLEATNHETEENLTNDQENSGPFTGESASLAFYHQACRLLPNVITIASVESVQACLILGVFALPFDASGLAWTYLGIAVKLAVMNGMHRKCSEDCIDPQTKETRNRIWWSVYALERLVHCAITIQLPYRTSLPDSSITNLQQTYFPVDRCDVWTSTTSFFACLDATLHLNEMLSRLAREIPVEPQRSLHRLTQFQSELVVWWESLPSILIRPESASLSPEIRLRSHVKLEYCLARMFIGRFFIFPKESPQQQYMSSTESGGPGIASSPTSLNTSNFHLITDCVDAALSAIETCRFLRNTIGLARASYTEFSSCRAALLVITTQCFQAKGCRFRHHLREGLTMLKEMAAWSELARTEASLIEAFERVILKLDVTQNESCISDSDFTQFKRWENMWKGSSSVLDPFGLVREEDMNQMTRPVWEDWPRPSDVTSFDPNEPGSFAMPSHRSDTGPPYFPQACEDLATLLGLGFPLNLDISSNH
ncbi:hypothetical protein PENPOL_c003G08094 [Penicillium polonicum]|uniref:Zn(2)-C6 fungal-type domain-containing protein n=1 Tax=Penicillium polonicum TaxID=60169 RepID=A0A1V6NTP8_PENPO|nr:hypothetical protein PENPOL_c003G08094 [Penicillium polonicum]